MDRSSRSTGSSPTGQVFAGRGRVRRWPGRLLLATAALAVTVAGACGDDQSPEEAFCDARDDLSSSVQSVVDDARAGNFGEAQDGLDDVEAAADEVAETGEDLGADTRAEVQGDVDELRSTLDTLGAASSLEELGASLEDATASIDGIVDALGNTVDCQ